MSAGWRQNFADMIAAVRGTLADAFDAGSMSAADFLKLAGLPPTAPPTSRLINTTAPLTGGGNLSADRTLAISAASGGGAGSMSAADFSKLAGLPSTAPPTSRLINTTAPLTGGGDLSADRTLAISPADASNPGSLAAADFSKLATAPSGAILEVGWFLGTDVDLTATGQTAVSPAAPAGKLFVPTKLISIVSAVAGAITTPPTISWGNNGSWNNALAAGTVSVPAAAFNAGAGGTTALNPFGGGGSNSTAAFSINVTVGATGTGGFAYRGKFGILGYYVTFP